MAPQSRTGYTLDDYRIIAAQSPVTKRTGPDGPEELIDWANVTAPEEVVCVPSLTDKGYQIDLWGETNHRIKMSRFFRMAFLPHVYKTNADILVQNRFSKDGLDETTLCFLAFGT